MDNNNNSGVNTILIVVVLVIIVAFGVWYFMGGFGADAPADDNAEFNLQVDMPEGEGDGGGSAN